MAKESASQLRKLPPVDRIMAELAAEASPTAAAYASREAIAEARAAIEAGGQAPAFTEVLERARYFLETGLRSELLEVVNATGVILHTNLGRAPLGTSGSAAAATTQSVAGSYSNLEYDLAEGKRGSRYEHASRLLQQLTGAKGALVVNNNAAAVLLVLAALATGREVVISRGELIEIGGGFRIPEVLAESGGILNEVGTTNRTHLTDYESALNPETAAILKVHPSNYEVVGFAKSVTVGDLAELAHSHGIPLIHDIGSGLIRRRVSGMDIPWLAEEPTVMESLDAGADIVTFSGDKLLGGPQAGIIVGDPNLIDRMLRAPLLRAVRVDKMTLANLEATLRTYLEGKESELPLWSLALQDSDSIRKRAERIKSGISEEFSEVEVVAGHSTTGGGSAPGAEIPTFLLTARAAGQTPQQLHRTLIGANPPIVARVSSDKLVIDLRCVPLEQDTHIAETLLKASAGTTA